jgi:CubicO group peptidase (beta-lactamase class C family)
MKLASKSRIALCPLLTVLSVACSFAQGSLPKGIDEYVERVRKVFEVPGIGLGVVKDGKVLLAKGYGVCRLGEEAVVDSKTLFGIASNTKAFTATALGLLAEEGKLEWDAPVSRYLPWFQLSDPYVTRELTIRDLLVHRSGLGLGAGDLLWWPPSTYDRKEISRRLRYLPLATSFRSAYAYDNVLYTVAGEVIEAISGLPWEDFVGSRILTTVGMKGSNVRHSDAGSGGNVATPHASIEGKVRPVNPFASDNTNPAGGINSNAEDMAKWMIVQLDSGRVSDGTSLFTPRLTAQLWQLVTPIPIGTRPAELRMLRPNFRGYGLGFDVLDYGGKKMVTHTGGLPGYVSRVTMVPELKLGVVVLTNQESSEAFDAITYRLLDHYLGISATDWIQAFQTVRVRNDSVLAVRIQKARAARDSTSHPSLSLDKYAGVYSDVWYGDILITMEQGRLVIAFSKTPLLIGDLHHWQYDTFVARWRDRELRADAYVTFSLNPDGTIDQAKMQAISPATDFSFDFRHLLLKPKPRK